MKENTNLAQNYAKTEPLSCGNMHVFIRKTVNPVQSRNWTYHFKSFDLMNNVMILGTTCTNLD